MNRGLFSPLPSINTFFITKIKIKIKQTLSFQKSVVISQTPNSKKMDQEILGDEQDFELSAHSTIGNEEDRYFNELVTALQESILDEEFSQKQDHFLKAHSQSFQVGKKKGEKNGALFSSYKFQIGTLLQEKMKQRIASFDLSQFVCNLGSFQNRIDDVLYEILLSFIDLDAFESLLADYQTAHQEEEMYKALTIKTNKIPEHKKVKGASENIFSNANVPFSMRNSLTKKLSNENKRIVEKTEDELFVAEKVLTVKGLRKN